MEYPIYCITLSETMWDMGTSIVSAENSEESLSILEKQLTKDFGGEVKGDIGFKNRGGIFDTGFKTDKKGVIYSYEYKKELQKDFWNKLKNKK